MTQTVESAVAGKVDQGRLVTVAAGATVRDGIDITIEEPLGAVLIENEDGLIDGIFTERDVLLRVVQERRNPDTTPISLVMDGPRVLGLVSIGDMAGQLLLHGQGRFETAMRQKVKATDLGENH